VRRFELLYFTAPSALMASSTAVVVSLGGAPHHQCGWRSSPRRPCARRPFSDFLPSSNLRIDGEQLRPRPAGSLSTKESARRAVSLPTAASIVVASTGLGGGRLGLRPFVDRLLLLAFRVFSFTFVFSNTVVAPPRVTSRCVRRERLRVEGFLWCGSPRPALLDIVRPRPFRAWKTIGREAFLGGKGRRPPPPCRSAGPVRALPAGERDLNFRLREAVRRRRIGRARLRPPSPPSSARSPRRPITLSDRGRIGPRRQGRCQFPGVTLPGDFQASRLRRWCRCCLPTVTMCRPRRPLSRIELEDRLVAQLERGAIRRLIRDTPG